MADIASGDVTYTQVNARIPPGSGRAVRQFTVVFGNNTLLYPTGGVPLLKQSLACPNSLDSLDILDQGSNAKGYKFEWDKANNKLRIMVVGAATPAGTISKPTFTVESAGAIGTNMEVGLSADSAAATYEGGTGITAQRTLTTTSPVGVPVFTGTAIAAGAPAEHANATFVPNPATLLVEVVGY